jgi:hypothetical protein
MTAALALHSARPAPFQRVSYRAFRLDGDLTSEIRIGEPGTLQEAVDAAKLACLHKECLAIREADDDGARLHIFVIRKARPAWVREGFRTVRVETLRADLVAVVPGSVLATKHGGND